MVLSTILSLPKSISKQTSSTHNTVFIIVLGTQLHFYKYKRLHFQWILSHPIELMMWKLMSKKKTLDKKGISLLSAQHTDNNWIEKIEQKKKCLFNWIVWIIKIPMYTHSSMLSWSEKTTKTYSAITCYVCLLNGSSFFQRITVQSDNR